MFISNSVLLPASTTTGWFSLTTAIGGTGYTNLAPATATDYTTTDLASVSGSVPLVPINALTGWTAPSTGSTGAATPSFCT